MADDGDLAVVRGWADGTRAAAPLEAFRLWGPPGPYHVGGADCAPRAISAAAAAYVRSLPQQTPLWKRVRAPFFSGSLVGKKVGLGYVPWGSTREAEVAAEFAVDAGRAARPWRQTPAMQFGVEQEPMGREAYALFRDAAVAATNLVVCEDPGRGHVAASPDGLVGADGLVEVKVSATARRRALPAYHVPQGMAQMRATGRAWCDFALLYLPATGEDAADPARDRSELSVVRLHFSEEYQAAVEDALRRYGEAAWRRRLSGDGEPPAPLDPSRAPPYRVDPPATFARPYSEVWRCAGELLAEL